LLLRRLKTFNDDIATLPRRLRPGVTRRYHGADSAFVFVWDCVTIRFGTCYGKNNGCGGLKR